MSEGPPCKFRKESNEFFGSTARRSQENAAENDTSNIRDECVINYTLNGNTYFSKEVKLACKILNFSDEFSPEAVNGIISGLNQTEYPNLFCFSFNMKEENLKALEQTAENLQGCLNKFCPNRPKILQMVAKQFCLVYFKEEQGGFSQIKDTHDFTNLNDFPAIFKAFTNKLENFGEKILENISTMSNSGLVLRFLRLFNLPEEYLNKLILKCAANCTVDHLLASINTTFEHTKRITDQEAKNWIMSEIGDTSILHTAIQNGNKQIANFLVDNCSLLIQQLPFKHQIKISSLLFQLNEIDPLNHLLQYHDFPFPSENFKTKKKLRDIRRERAAFHKHIINDNFSEVEKFIENHRDLKNCYNKKNTSALYQAISIKRFKMYFYLLSYNFHIKDPSELVKIDKITRTDEWVNQWSDAKQDAENQRTSSIIGSSTQHEDLPILILEAKSRIFNKNIDVITEKLYRQKIKKWYKTINETKYGPEILKIVSACENLIIEFDFESIFIGNVCFTFDNQYDRYIGFTLSTCKWIFIGAKTTGDENCERKIMSTIMHEFSHYVMFFVFGNSGVPYFKNDSKSADDYKKIVTEYNKWTGPHDDDGCSGIISSGYLNYPENKIETEIIVRAVEISAFYHGHQELSRVEDRYRKLFDYLSNNVDPVLKKFNFKQQEDLKVFNKYIGNLINIKTSNLMVTSSEIKKNSFKNLTIITSKIPNMFLIDAYNNFHPNGAALFEMENILVNYDQINKYHDDYKNMLTKYQDLNVFVEYSEDIDMNQEDIRKIVITTSSRFIFVTQSEGKSKKLAESLKKASLNSKQQTIKYDWSNLPPESQAICLQHEIYLTDTENVSTTLCEVMEIDDPEEASGITESISMEFGDASRNHSEPILQQAANQNNKLNIFSVKTESNEKCSIKEYLENHKGELSEHIDEEFLKLLTQSNKISINCKISYEIDDAEYNLLFRERNFIKKVQGEGDTMLQLQDICQHVKNNTYVLLSGIAGTGKSWAMKKTAKVLRKNNGKRWVTYVDLKEHIADFKYFLDHRKKPDFLMFMTERIFASKLNFETKIFQKMYKTGKVFILFDGFDEVAPAYTQFLKDIILSFQKYGENQLWIATRDYFEVDLQKILKLDTTYNLDDFGQKDAIDLIVRNCIFYDLQISKEKIEDDFDQQVKNHPKYQTYKKSAENVYRKISNWTFTSIGLPQLFKMIGDVLNEFKNSSDEITELVLYKSFVGQLYNRWLEKNELRRNMNEETQNSDLNFHQLHEFIAMRSLFPGNSVFCGLELDKVNWNDDQIIGCGILDKSFLFPHETFREYFAASFIIRILTKKQVDRDVLKYLIKFCSSKKYKIICTFIAQGFGKVKTLPKNKLIIVNTNVSKLLQVNIYQILLNKNKNIEEINNIIVIPDDPESTKLYENFGEEFKQNSNLNAVVQPSKDFEGYLENNIEPGSTTIIVITSDEQRSKHLCEVFREYKFVPITLEKRYDWNDLTNESQNLLLQSEINFENHSITTLIDVLSNCVQNNDQSTGEKREDFSKEIDDYLLNILLNKSLVRVGLNYEMEEISSQLLYQPRSIINVHTQKISEEELLNDVDEKKFVLISDVAGSGKSTSFQNLTNILRFRNPKKWITYVDLKQFIDAFRTVNEETSFHVFMMENILRFDDKFIRNYFMRLYKTGKVLILFDGFDEIAPNYAEFVSKLAKSFEQNGGNQLWIATRDYFEVYLKEKLELSVAYSLGEMTEEEGVNFIAKSWVLLDLRLDKSELKSKAEFEECLKMSPNYKSYQQKARKIICKALFSINDSAGRPQFFKMIADGFKNEKNIEDLQGSKIYSKFINILYTRWASMKGQIREEANVYSQQFELNFYKFHQYHAILSLFPELVPILFPGYDGSEWPKEEVIACGIMTKRNGKYYFIYRTICEYLCAEAIVRSLRNVKVEKKVLKILDEVLTEDNFQIIRTFLFSGLNEKYLLEKVKTQIEKTVYCGENFGFFFVENLDNLADFAIEVLKNGSYEEGKAILDKNAASISRNTQSSKMLSRFQNFIIHFLKVDDLKKLIIKGKTFEGIIGSSLEVEIFEEFVLKTEAKTDPEFIRQELMSDDNGQKNIFHFLSTSSNLNAHKVNKFLKIMEKFLTSAEISELMSKCNNDKQNILQVCAECEKEENLNILWTEVEKYFADQNFSQSSKV